MAPTSRILFGLAALVGGAFGLLIALNTEVIRGGAGVTIAGLLVNIVAVRMIEKRVGKLRLPHKAVYAVTLFAVAILVMFAIPGRAPT